MWCVLVTISKRNVIFDSEVTKWPFEDSTVYLISLRSAIRIFYWIVLYRICKQYVFEIWASEQGTGRDNAEAEIYSLTSSRRLVHAKCVYTGKLQGLPLRMMSSALHMTRAIGDSLRALEARHLRPVECRSHKRGKLDLPRHKNEDVLVLTPIARSPVHRNSALGVRTVINRGTPCMWPRWYSA